MPCCASVAAKFLPENHGKRRENGVERTSAMASTPASRSNATKRSAGIFEWPMLNRSKDDIAESLAEKLRQFHGRQHIGAVNRRCRAYFFARLGSATMLPALPTKTMLGDCNAPVALCGCHRRMGFGFPALWPARRGRRRRQHRPRQPDHGGQRRRRAAL